MARRYLTTAMQALQRAQALASRDPATAGRLAIVAVFGLGLIWLWGLYGEFFLSNFTVVTAGAILVVAYAGVLVVLTAELVRAEDLWQVESALTLRDLLADRSEQTGSQFYVRQLRRRLDEEIRRCRQNGMPLTVVAMRLEVATQSPSHAILTQSSTDMADLAMAHRDMMVCLTSLGLFEYAFFLPHHDSRSARAVADFLVRALARYHCSFGLAVFPDDGADADSLLGCAIEQCGMLRGAAA